MKQALFFAMAALALALAGCGSNNNNSVNGTWTAALTNPGGSPAFNFTTTLNQSGGSSVSVESLNFTTNSPCFKGGATATAAFTISGTMNGVTGGGYQMTIKSKNPTGNTLTLTGTLGNNTINGAWTLTGSTGCTGTGSFTMSRT